MTAMATGVITDIAMRLKIGTAVCAVAVAAAVPTVVANAEPAVPAPIAPVTQVLAEPILGPITFAEQNCLVPGGPGCEGQRRPIDAFSALVLAVVGIFILPVVIVAGVVASVVGAIFRPGPYRTGV